MERRTPRKVPTLNEIKINLDKINELQQEILKDDPTEFVPAEIRNVLFCGASRSGKSTVFQILQNPCYCPQKITIFSETKFTTFKTFSLRDTVKKTVYNFVVNLIDTPGTFEVRSSKEEFAARSNDQISNLIIDCINHEVVYLNLMVLVINANKFSDTDMDSVDLFIKLFGESKIPIIVCLTHADNLGEERRKEIVVQLQDYPRLKPYFEKNLFEIQWMGCVNYIQKDYTNEEVMMRDYTLVANWRDDMVSRIFNAEKRIYLEETDIYLYKMKECYLLLDKLLNGFNDLIDVDVEHLPGGLNLRLIEHSNNMNKLFDLSFYLDKSKDPEIMDKYNTFHVFMNRIRISDKPKQLKGFLLGNWFNVEMKGQIPAQNSN